MSSSQEAMLMPVGITPPPQPACRRDHAAGAAPTDFS
jgi:hypothetical protein